MLALSLLEFLFGLLISRSICDKTPKCFGVVPVSVSGPAVLLMNAALGGEPGTMLWFHPEPVLLCEASGKN